MARAKVESQDHGTMTKGHGLAMTKLLDNDKPVGNTLLMTIIYNGEILIPKTHKPGLGLIIH